MYEMRVASMAFAVKRRIEALHQFARLFSGHVFVATEHDAVGPREVFHCRALFQELRVRHHREHVTEVARGKLFGDCVANA